MRKDRVLEQFTSKRKAKTEEKRDTRTLADIKISDQTPALDVKEPSDFEPTIIRPADDENWKELKDKN